MPLSQVIQGKSYTPFIITIDTINKHRPFSNEIDLLPKIGQLNEDNYDLCSPRSSHSSNHAARINAENDDY